MLPSHAQLCSLDCQAELNATLEIKQRLEEQLMKYSDETEHLKQKADDYSQELRQFITKVSLLNSFSSSCFMSCEVTDCKAGVGGR